MVSFAAFWGGCEAISLVSPELEMDGAIPRWVTTIQGGGAEQLSPS